MKKTLFNAIFMLFGMAIMLVSCKENIDASQKDFADKFVGKYIGNYHQRGSLGSVYLKIPAEIQKKSATK